MAEQAAPKTPDVVSGGDAGRFRKFVDPRRSETVQAARWAAPKAWNAGKWTARKTWDAAGVPVEGAKRSALFMYGLGFSTAQFGFNYSELILIIVGFLKWFGEYTQFIDPVGSFSLL